MGHPVVDHLPLKNYWPLAKGWYFPELPRDLSRENPFFQDKPEDKNLPVTPAQGDSSYPYFISASKQSPQWSPQILQCDPRSVWEVQWPHESCKVYLVVKSLACHTAAMCPSWGPLVAYWHELPLHGGLSINPWSLSEQSFCQLIIITIYLLISLKQAHQGHTRVFDQRIKQNKYFAKLGSPHNSKYQLLKLSRALDVCSLPQSSSIQEPLFDFLGWTYLKLARNTILVVSTTSQYYTHYNQWPIPSCL